MIPTRIRPYSYTNVWNYEIKFFHREGVLLHSCNHNWRSFRWIEHAGKYSWADSVAALQPISDWCVIKVGGTVCQSSIFFGIESIKFSRRKWHYRHWLKLFVAGTRRCIPKGRYLWPPYGIGQPIIFSSCGFFFFLLSFFLSFFPRLFSASRDRVSNILPAHLAAEIGWTELFGIWVVSS